jgi:hypothetical protein
MNFFLIFVEPVLNTPPMVICEPGKRIDQVMRLEWPYCNSRDSKMEKMAGVDPDHPIQR